MRDTSRALSLLMNKLDDTLDIIEAAQKTYLLAERLDGPSPSDKDIEAAENELITGPNLSMTQVLEIMAQDMMREALHKANWNISKAAELLGESRNKVSLCNRIWKLGVPDPDSRTRLRLEAARFIKRLCIEEGTNIAR